MFLEHLYYLTTVLVSVSSLETIEIMMKHVTQKDFNQNPEAKKCKIQRKSSVENVKSGHK